ncbi:MAG: hypothetical protein K0U74_10415 [Alphaproteobacteria bacterium]|nr:hypothetical protein [Alphaproteobacteria bacterium]
MKNTRYNLVGTPYGAWRVGSWLTAFTFVALQAYFCAAASAQNVSDGLASDWVKGHASRVRLVAGRSNGAGADASMIVAGVEIELDPGWKTYWRNPGDAGGVPPQLDFSKSSNVAGAQVFYPAPKRLTDKSGDTIGYKNHVVFPVLIKPVRPSEPLNLELDFSFGVCADICIPAQAEFSLAVPQGVSLKVPEDVHNALGQVPRAGDKKQAGDPELLASSIVWDGKEPHIVLDVKFPGGAKKGDVFGEAPPGIYLPMARRVATQGSDSQSGRFVIDLREAFDLAELKGETIKLTMVGAKGQSESQLVLK